MLVEIARADIKANTMVGLDSLEAAKQARELVLWDARRYFLIFTAGFDPLRWFY